MVSFCFTSMAFADWGSMLNAVKSNPLVTQQGKLQEVISKLQSIAGAFSQMPLNSGKLEFIKVAMPLLNQAKGINLLQQGKTVDTNQAGKLGGLLDQVKSLAAQKWSSTPLTQAQVPQATTQVKQFTDTLTGLINNQGNALKALL